MYNTYEKNKMIALLYRIFQAEDYRWDKEENVPTFAEIAEAVEELEESALEHGQAESGRIKVFYDTASDTFEYYLNLGGN